MPQLHQHKSIVGRPRGRAPLHAERPQRFPLIDAPPHECARCCALHAASLCALVFVFVVYVWMSSPGEESLLWPDGFLIPINSVSEIAQRNAQILREKNKHDYFIFFLEHFGPDRQNNQNRADKSTACKQ